MVTCGGAEPPENIMVAVRFVCPSLAVLRSVVVAAATASHVVVGAATGENIGCVVVDAAVLAVSGGNSDNLLIVGTVLIVDETIRVMGTPRGWTVVTGGA